MKKRRRKRVKNQNQLDWIAERRKFKNKPKRPIKERATNIDFLFWQIAQERKHRGAKNVVHG